MAHRGEITGRKPRATDDRARRRKGPPRADPNGPTSHAEPQASTSTNTQPIRGPPIPPALYTIASFCSAHFLSESMFHKMREMGIGPQVMRVGTRVFVTFESASAWRRERERAEREAMAASAGEATE